MRSLQTYVWSVYGTSECGVVALEIKPQGATDLHDHLFHETALVTRGRAIHVTVNGRQMVQKGDLIVLRPQTWHGYEQVRAGFSVINCLLAPTMLRQLLPLSGASRGIQELFFTRPRRPDGIPPIVLRLTRPEHESIYTGMRRIADESLARGVDWPAVATGAALEMMARIARVWARLHASEQVMATLTPRAEQAVQRVAHLLEENLTNRVTLRELARRVGLAPAYLSRCFAMRMGVGLIDYAHRLRVEEACRLLRLTDLPVTTIAQRLGYEEIAYFSRRFHRTVGVSPRAYRRGR